MSPLGRSVRVLVGDSVFEDAVITVHDGWLHVEFESADMDNIAIPLSILQ